MEKRETAFYLNKQGNVDALLIVELAQKLKS